MKIGQFKLKMLFVLFAGFLLAAGCSESDSPEFEQSRRLVRNLYLAPVMSVYAGQTLTLQGVGFEAGDVVSFRADAAVFDLPVSGVTAKTARVVIPAAIARESYDVYVVRGAQEQYVATVKIYLTTDQEVPDKEGMNIKGIVFCGDKGVPGVRVSDGLQTVTTDENGYYWIPSLKTLGYVFITIPQGYLPAALDNNMMMGFWAGLTDEAGVCENHNFELVEADTENHVMLVGADLHLADKQNDLRNFKNGFIAETQAFADASSVPVFCLMAGDMTWDRYWYDRNFRLPHYRQWLSRNGYSVPVFHAMGNHDNDPYVQGDAPGQLSYCRTLGPNYYSFNLGKVHYVVLDDIDWINTGGSDGVLGSRDYNRVVSLAQMTWLAEDLAAVEDKTAPLVVCLHVQLYENYNASFANTAKMRGADECRPGFLRGAFHNGAYAPQLHDGHQRQSDRTQHGRRLRNMVVEHFLFRPGHLRRRVACRLRNLYGQFDRREVELQGHRRTCRIPVPHVRHEHREKAPRQQHLQGAAGPVCEP